MGGLVAFEIARTDYLSRRSPLSRSCRETPGFPGLYRPVFEGQAALARTLSDLPTFRDAYAAASCRWTVSLSGRPSKGRKQNSRLPSPELEGTGFRRVDLHVPIITDANDLVADIHDHMPLILATDDYTRWLGEEPDPRDLMRPSPPSRCACGRFRPHQQTGE
jgi:hypothetical protein